MPKNKVHTETQTVIRAALLARTKCATCNYDKSPAAVEVPKGHWNHLYDDGSYMGSCFDPIVARALAALKESK